MRQITACAYPCQLPSSLAPVLSVAGGKTKDDIYLDVKRPYGFVCKREYVCAGAHRRSVNERGVELAVCPPCLFGVALLVELGVEVAQLEQETPRVSLQI